MNPSELSADYPNSDIIAFQPSSNIIVHRIVDKEDMEGILYFYISLFFPARNKIRKTTQNRKKTQKGTSGGMVTIDNNMIAILNY